MSNIYFYYFIISTSCYPIIKNCKDEIDYQYLARLIDRNSFNAYVLICLDFIEEEFGQFPEIDRVFLSNIRMGVLRKKAVRNALLNLWSGHEKKIYGHINLYRIMAFSNGTIDGFMKRSYFYLRSRYLSYLDAHRLKISGINFFKYLIYLTFKRFRSALNRSSKR